MRQKSVLTAILAALFLAIAWSVPVNATTCNSGYCPNANSPVVGGWVWSTQTTTYCTQWSYSAKGGSYCSGTWQTKTTSGISQYFGDVSSANCPPNTAVIKVPNGYTANNGRTYGANSSSYKTTVCVKTDTY